jgi:hypothetical protein
MTTRPCTSWAADMGAHTLRLRSVRLAATGRSDVPQPVGPQSSHALSERIPGEVAKRRGLGQARLRRPCPCPLSNSKARKQMAPVAQRRPPARIGHATPRTSPGLARRAAPRSRAVARGGGTSDE